MAWMLNYLKNINGNGLVYTGTTVNTEIYSKWLESEKINTIFYHSKIDGDIKKDIEKEWMNDKYKAVIATNALGMGIDKSNIRFIIHTQITQSLIHYYQEIGRAGRDGKRAEIFLLFNPKDKALPLNFINGARPSVKKYEKVISALKEEPLGEKNLMKATNLKQTQVRTIKADLLDQKIIREVMYGRSKKYEYQHNAPQLDTTVFENLRNHRLEEFNQMLEYTNTDSCKMLYLCNYLGDSNSNSCKICDSCLHNKHQFSMSENDQEKIKRFQDSFFPLLEVETAKTNLINGVASSYYGFSNVGAIIHKCKYENGGDYPIILLKQTLRAFGRTFKEQKFDLVLFVPPTKSGKLVENFANKIASTLKLPIVPLVKTRDTKEQKIFQIGALKTENIKDAFGINIDIMNKSILLIDDIFDSGATIKEIGKMLTNRGAKVIAPLVIAKTAGGDIAN